jgi:nicotinate-nucleotide adenylyltransferase
VLGGTFDPVHYGHLRLAETARDADRLSLDKLLFIPAGQPWRKGDRVVSHPSHRSAMLGLAIQGNPAFEMSTLELEREGPSYTVDTLEILREHYPGSELFLIMGQDALADLPNWREPERIVALTWLAVASRSTSRPERLTKPESLPPGARARVLSLPMEALEISGSGIRESVRRGASIRYLVPEAVRLYIEDHELYRE